MVVVVKRLPFFDEKNLVFLDSRFQGVFPKQ